jgi:hypothetical protein
VTVNGNATARKGEYFAGRLSVNNSTGAVWAAVTTFATVSNTTATTNGNVFFARSPENFLHDADGNLVSDGRWANRWDAENRLVSMETLSSVPTGAAMRVTFQYDWMGRRVLKAVQKWHGRTWPITFSNRFVYDGWNLVAELNATNNNVVRSFVWGTDLSGSEQGAGGVGGLLFVTTSGTATNAVGFDANGNVETLFDATTGTVSGSYAYGPF